MNRTITPRLRRLKHQTIYVYFAAIFLTLGLGFSSSTGLRGLPLGLGPAEVSFLGFIGCMVIFLAKAQLPITSRYTWPYVFSLSFAFLVMLVMSGVSQLVGHHARALPHDLMAYGFCLAVLLFLSTFIEQASEVFTRVLSYSFLIAFVLVLMSVVIGPAFGISPFYSSRLSGPAINPNQLAFHLSMAPFFLVRIARGERTKFLYYFLAIGCLLVSLLTLSDAFFVGLAAALCIWIFQIYCRPVKKPAWQLVVMWLMVPSLVVSFGLAFLDTLIPLVHSTLEVFDNTHQLFKRFTLWFHAAEASYDYFGLGAGFGAHSGFHGPYDNMEAHNSFVDWLAAGGVPSVLAVLSAIAVTSIRLWNQHERLLLSALVCLFFVSFFHLAFRHPMLWIYFVALHYFTVKRGKACAA